MDSVINMADFSPHSIVLCRVQLPRFQFSKSTEASGRIIQAANEASREVFDIHSSLSINYDMIMIMDRNCWN